MHPPPSPFTRSYQPRPSNAQPKFVILFSLLFPPSDFVPEIRVQEGPVGLGSGLGGNGKPLSSSDFASNPSVSSSSGQRPQHQRRRPDGGGGGGDLPQQPRRSLLSSRASSGGGAGGGGGDADGVLLGGIPFAVASDSDEFASDSEGELGTAVVAQQRKENSLS